MRDVVERLAPEAVCRPEPRACLEREPTDERLANTVEWRPVRTTPNPTLEPTPPPRSPKNEVDALFARLATAAEAGDTAGMREAARRYVQTDDARRWRDEGRAYNASFVDEPAHEPAHRAEPERPPMHELPEATAPVMRR